MVITIRKWAGRLGYSHMGNPHFQIEFVSIWGPTYTRAGFRFHTILMDGEFEKNEAEMPNLVCNTTAAKEYVNKAKHSICTLKEWMRGIVCMLPF